jgi:hypothetical protein
MKKIFMFLTLVSLIAFTSCSDDDGGSSASGTITARVNGVDKTFNVTSVKQELSTEGEFSWYDVIIITKQSDDASKTFELNLTKNEIGDGAAWGFSYYDDENYYYCDDIAITSNATESNNAGAKGSFSGIAIDEETSETIEITNGIFDVKY